jgi:uncharacterized protein (DUF1501 family)
MAENSLTRMAEQSTNDRVLIILQMHGGNDGLNSIIPVEAYDLITNGALTLPFQQRTVREK